LGLRGVLSKLGIVFGGFLALATLSIMNTAYTNVLDDIKNELTLTYTWSGALMSGYFVGYTLGQIPWGLLSDRYGSRRTIVISLLGVSLSTLLFGYSNTLQAAIVFRVLSGLLGAGIFVPSVKLISNWFDSEERGTALGLLNIGGSTGIIAASWMVPFLSSSTGWRGSLRLVGGFGVLLALICLHYLKDKQGASSRRLRLMDIPLREPRFWYLCFIQFIRLGVYYTFIAWMPLVLKEEYGLSVVSTSAAISLLNIAGIISNPIGGIASDRLSEKRVLLICFVSLSLFIYLFTLGFTSMLFPLVFILGWFINFSRSPSFSIIPRLFGVEAAGSISGVNNTFASLGALILPLILGYVRDSWNSYTVGWYAMAFLALQAASLTYLLSPQRD